MTRPEGATADDLEFTGSVPELYDRLMVPMIFADAAVSLARKVAAREPARILETAAGTGVLTEALVAACPGAEILATDLNQPMLARAATRLGGAGRVRFQQADALDLPVADASFDVVACQFGVMFFPDRVRGHREAHRVLRPGGALVLGVWDSLITNDFARVITDAVQELAGDGALDFMDRVPYGYSSVERVEEDLAAAGFGAVSIEAVDATSTATAEDAAVALCQGTPLCAAIEAHPAVTLDEATRAARDALQREYGDGVMAARMRWLEVVAEAG